MPCAISAAVLASPLVAVAATHPTTAAVATVSTKGAGPIRVDILNRSHRRIT